MEAAIQRIERLTRSLTELQPLKPDYQQKLDRKIRLEFNYNSNHLEGNTLSYNETGLLLIFDKTTGNHKLREYEEMRAHDVAFELIKEWAADKERPLTEAAIKNLHKVLLVRPFWNDAQTPDGHPTRREIQVGNYKEFSNNVRLQNGETFDFASPQDTPILMGELIQWYREEEKKEQLHPVEIAARFHYRFVLIHPFDDGNGRISRLLMNYVLFKYKLPPVIIKSAEKENYFFALNQADSGNLDAFVEYIANQLLWSLDISIKAAKGENIEEKEDLDKKLFLLKKKLGEEPNTAIQLSYSDEAVVKVINEVVIPLAHAWEERLKGFDALFISRTISFSSENKNYKAAHFDDGFENFCHSFLESKPVKANTFLKILMRCSPIGLRKIDNSISFNGGEINIEFFRNAYEIDYTNGAQRYNKLYHQVLKKEEIENIVSDLGTFLYRIIEETVDANNK